MKIALINGSPKAKNSTSGYVLQTLKPLLPNEHEMIEYYFRMPHISNRDLEQIAECDILVFAFPLYVDGLPLEIMKNWCEKAKLKWGQGIGIGGGGMLAVLAGVPDGQGLKKNLLKALNAIACSISLGTTADDLYISPNFPRFAYKLGAEMGWRQQGKANGLKTKDLFMKR
ncbi:MAG: hypothetical protein K0Q65_3405 [Clostridia bacterium]|nr:hypothetical protein [Clostridia bacterium]